MDFDWKALGAAVVKLGLPLLGAALPLPGGAALGTALATTLTGAMRAEGSPGAIVAPTPDAILRALTDSAAAQAAARQFEQTHQETMLRMTIDAEVAGLQAVNTTMQAEAKADHWPTYSWRPFIGFVFGAYVASLFLLPMFGKAPVPLSSDITLAIGAVLGVASFFRGKAQADPAINTDPRG